LEEAALEQLAYETKHRPKSAARTKRQVDTLKSKIPMKWAGSERYARLGTEAQAQQKAFRDSDRPSAMDQKKSFSACPPGTCVQRHVGQPAWHGNAYYAQIYAQAMRTKSNNPYMANPYMPNRPRK